MNDTGEPPLSLDRFLWLQDFAARLMELGAPGSVQELMQLGEDLYESSAGKSAREIAEFVWQQWPTEHGSITGSTSRE